MNHQIRDPERVTERAVADWLRQGVQALPDGDALPDGVMARVIDEIELLPRRMGWRAWLERDRLAPGAVGTRAIPVHRTSLTAMIVVALALGSMLALASGLAIQSIVSWPTPGATLHVAQDGSGEFATLADAVTAAEDGDTVLVAPGTYTEAVVIEHDITVRGDGDRDEIVVVALEGGPRARVMFEDPLVESDSYAVLLKGSSATLTNLTFRGGSSVVHASGGSPTLLGLAFQDVGLPYRKDPSWWESSSVVINDRSQALVQDSLFMGGGGVTIHDGSDARIIDNEFLAGASIQGRPGDGADIRGNTIKGASVAAVIVEGPSRVTVAENYLVDVAVGIQVGWSRPKGADPHIQANTIVGAETAISIHALSDATITDNVLVDNSSAILISGSDVSVVHNEMEGNRGGVFVMQGAPEIRDNTIVGGTVGLGLGGDEATPSLSGNTICGNVTNVYLASGAAMPDTAGNEICADGQEPASQ